MTPAQTRLDHPCNNTSATPVEGFGGAFWDTVGGVLAHRIRRPGVRSTDARFTNAGRPASRQSCDFVEFVLKGSGCGDGRLCAAAALAPRVAQMGDSVDLDWAGYGRMGP